jgi:hypothetical protein
MRGEFGFARHTVESFLQEAKTEGRPREAAIANRNLGYTCLHQGEVTNAQAHLEEALRTYNPEGDSDATILFAQDHRAAATAFLALTKWVLGEVASARTLMEKAVDRAAESAHVPGCVLSAPSRKLPMAPGMRCRTGFPTLQHFQQRGK